MIRLKKTDLLEVLGYELIEDFSVESSHDRVHFLVHLEEISQCFFAFVPLQACITGELRVERESNLHNDTERVGVVPHCQNVTAHVSVAEICRSKNLIQIEETELRIYSWFL